MAKLTTDCTWSLIQTLSYRGEEQSSYSAMEFWKLGQKGIGWNSIRFRFDLIPEIAHCFRVSNFDHTTEHEGEGEKQFRYEILRNVTKWNWVELDGIRRNYRELVVVERAGFWNWRELVPQYSTSRNRMCSHLVTSSLR